MTNATPDLRLPSQPQGITVFWLVPIYTAWWRNTYEQVVPVCVCLCVCVCRSWQWNSWQSNLQPLSHKFNIL